MTPSSTEHPFELPRHLADRTRWLARGGGGDLVVCWLHHASRVEENPVLEVAIEAAAAASRPLLVHAGFGGRHPHNNDRHLQFMLEGWRVVQRDLAERGIPMSITPPPRTGDPSGLAGLAPRCRYLVTEDWPRSPYPAWTAGWAERIPGDLLAVDAACIVPMRQVRGVHDRAFKFRRAVESEWESRVAAPWPATLKEVEPAAAELLPATNLDLSRTKIPELLATWDIDHSVGPVPGILGGADEASNRWAAFRDSGLDHYAARRNDALVDGTSGLSPWLHHGMLSPFRIAREAHLRGGAGAEKFLDELLVWRELSFHFCLTHRIHDTVEALPTWARDTLDSHLRDDRDVRTWETLARGRTGDRLWDEAQHALRERGWLHNNLRMTWGKAIASWSADPNRTLERLIDLNDRYALDGHDPNSIGGLLWCLGLFDRAFPEDRPITGRIRARPTGEHARRLSPPRYAERRRKVLRDTVLIVGGGVCGSIAARTLLDHGHAVRILDKGRGPGGRLSTRRRDEVQFDHGCQVLRLRGEHRHCLTRSWIEEGVVESWTPRVRHADGSISPPDATWYVGVPGMNALVRHIQRDVQVDFDAEVADLGRDRDEWIARDASGTELGRGRRLVLAVPPIQAARLLAEIAPDLVTKLADVQVDPVWTLMAHGVQDAPDFDVAIDPSPDIKWMAREDSRPRRPIAGAWSIHASTEWTRNNLEIDRAEAEPRLRTLVHDAVGLRMPVGVAHRWRYGLTSRPLGVDHLSFGEGTGLVAGDWCLGGRVEHAIESGIAAAGAILRAPDGARLDDSGGTLFEAIP